MLVVRHVRLGALLFSILLIAIFLFFFEGVALYSSTKGSCFILSSTDKSTGTDLLKTSFQ